MQRPDERKKMIGSYIRSCHPYAYKSRQWGQIEEIVWQGDRWLLKVVWPSGNSDWWPLLDVAADYDMHSGDTRLPIACDRHERSPIREPWKRWPGEQDAIEQLRKAWKDEGPVPPYHQAMQIKFIQEWPALGEAVLRLVKVTGEK